MSDLKHAETDYIKLAKQGGLKNLLSLNCEVYISIISCHNHFKDQLLSKPIKLFFFLTASK